LICFLLFWRFDFYLLKVTIQTDDMELAGNIIQSMGKFLNIEDLQTTGDFPQELEVLQKVFSHVIFG
jgi:Bardet-Biedl syndrome 2 protein